MVQRDFVLGSLRESLLGIDGGEPPAVTEPAQPKLASTVMLVRDDEGPLEVFMLRRASSMAFAPSMHVFPGGGVDRRDAVDELPWAGPAVEEWAEVFGTDEASARMLVAAAIRHEIGFGQVPLEHHLVLRSDLLSYRAHWITPGGTAATKNRVS